MSTVGNGPGEFLWRKTLAGASFLLAAQGGRLICQMAVLILLARGLGAAGLGAVAVLLGVANILRPLSGFGYHILVVQEASRFPERMPRMLGQSIPAHLVAGSLLTVLGSLLIVPLLKLELGLTLVFVLLLGELCLGGLNAFLSNSWQAEERFAAQARWLLVVPALRAIGLAAFVYLGRLDIPTFVLVQCGSLLVAVLFGFTLRMRAHGPLRIGPPSSIVSSVRMGLPFAFGLVGLGLLPEIDKLLVPRLAGLEVAGQYAAGIKAINFAVLPLGSILAAFLPRFFREGQFGSRAALAVARKAWLATTLYSLGVGLLILLAAPLAVPVLGGGYDQVPQVIRSGAGLLVLQALHLPAGHALSGSGAAKFRAWAQVGVAVVAAGVALVSIPSLGWKGALLAAYAGHGLLVLLLVLNLLRRAGREPSAHSSLEDDATRR